MTRIEMMNGEVEVLYWGIPETTMEKLVKKENWIVDKV